MKYVPDCWVVLKIDGTILHYKILAGWSGGYLTGDEWKLNSGILRVEEDEKNFSFYGSSGSVYVCNKEAYGLRNSTNYVYNGFKKKYGDKIDLMPENTNWAEMDWNL